jgi:tetratricopeptide (TPR) repeat protein
VCPLHQLASLYQAQGRYEQAEPLFKQALTIRERALGANHPDTALSVWWSAFLYDQQQEYEKAEPLYKHALSVYKRTLGEMHPDTQELRRQYVSLLRKLGRDEESDEIEKQGRVPDDLN